MTSRNRTCAVCGYESPYMPPCPNCAVQRSVEMGNRHDANVREAGAAQQARDNAFQAHAHGKKHESSLCLICELQEAT